MGWLENIVGKEEKVGNQHFLLFPQCFQKSFFQGCLKSELCGKWITYFFLGGGEGQKGVDQDKPAHT